MGNIRKSWIYKKLVSIKTAIFLLCVLTFFYSIGTIFSQNSEYAEEGGFALWIVRTFHLLDIYTHHASLFLYIAILFWISLFFCTLDRLIVLRKNRGKIGFTPFSLKTFKGSPGYREAPMGKNARASFWVEAESARSDRPARPLHEARAVRPRTLSPEGLR